MEYTLVLTVDNDTYRHYRKQGGIGGLDKKDKDYYARVVMALKDALEAAKEESRRLGNYTDI